MKYLLFLLVCVFSFRFVSAQSPNFGDNLPGSADVTAFSRSASIPVNFFTGIPSITIPIFNYEGNSINTNVSLDYFAGGIKVDEPATNTGLGWHLNTGGVIIRQLRGFPDDCPGRGFMYTPTVNPTSQNARPSRNGVTLPGFLDRQYAADSIDSQYDIYQYSFSGNAGSFIIGKDKKVVLIPEKNLKVRYTLKGQITNAPLSSIDEFSIIMEDGSAYVFSEKEITVRSNRPYYDAYKGYISAWYLKQIISPFGIDTITFNYNTNFTRSRVSLSAIRTEGYGDPQESVSADDILMWNKAISQIALPNNKTINFNYFEFSRCDANGQYALKSIELKDSSFRSGFRFNYKYFTETSGKEYNFESLSCPADISKLKLQSLVQYNPYRTFPPYEFTYSDLGVPKTGNLDKDHWGYYNKKNNTTNIPAAAGLPGANREPDALYVKAGSLSAIKYPRGNKTIFDFEINDEGTYYYNQPSTITMGPSLSNSVPIIVSSVSGKPLKFTFALTRPPGSVTACKTNIEIRNTAGTILDAFAVGYPDGIYERSISLPSGSYTLKWAKDAASTCTDDYLANATVTWVNEAVDYNFNRVGGLRIKKITYTDSASKAIPIVKQYNYKTTTGNSSGFVMTKPVYDYQFIIAKYCIPGYCPPGIPLTCRVSSPLNNLEYVNGSVIGYARVEEIVTGSGKTVYEYSTCQSMNYFPPQPVFPFANYPVPHWLLGLPTNVATYSESGKKLTQSSTTYNATTTELQDTLYKSCKLNPERRMENATEYIYAASFFYPLTGKVLPLNTTNITYSGTDSAMIESVNTFDQFNNLKNTRVTINKQLGQYMDTRFYYPYDYNTGGTLKRMKDSTIITPVSVEKWLIKNNTEILTDLMINDFQEIGNGSIQKTNVFKLVSNTPLSLSVIGAFNPNSLNRNNTYIRNVSSNNIFNNKSVPIETTDNLTQRKEALIWDNEQQTALAHVDNAGYGEIAYTSFESGNHGRWLIEPTGKIIYNIAMTGRQSFNFTGKITTTVNAGKQYKVTYWSTGNGATVNGNNGTKIKTRGLWSLYQHILNASTTTVSVVGSNITIDELRVYPTNAKMSTQTPWPFMGITSNCDPLNNITYFAYDDLGRQVLQKDEFGNITKMACYGNANETTDCNAVYKNEERRYSYIQQGCTNGKPDTVIYTIPAGKYTSAVSQYTVDSLANADAAANGQNNANVVGSCGTVYSKVIYKQVSNNSTAIYANFYSDPACTKPRTVWNLKVNYAITDNCASDQNDSVIANGTSAYLTSLPYFYYEYTDCPDYGQDCYTLQCNVDCVLKPGGYIIK
ncbi:hypothetical protein DVR12_25315 [Chitinophaga silvatica]|uniref:DUF5977 domain-containing protein n=1 Tax=Chitinophaga silvatica TaxID=2282649 RepID=A0A3E1Y372_9BACT|nr:DUF5977 domain-containing protein [Chitinophaga silvatica]RFS19128.1 hypothetical protein DVR12_25315 [Chitinophaga silvatica]